MSFALKYQKVPIQKKLGVISGNGLVLEESCVFLERQHFINVFYWFTKLSVTEQFFAGNGYRALETFGFHFISHSI